MPAVKFTNFCNMFGQCSKTITFPMIKRIVMMPLLPGKEALFMDIFENAKAAIRGQEGCIALEVLRSEHDGTISIWTISSWTSTSALDHYRTSDLFKSTW